MKELGNGKTVTYKINFVDSFRLMSSSLSNLVDNISERLHKNKCKYCKSCLEYSFIENFYPYEYLDSLKRFNETLLPDKEDFYSNLNMEDITDADYKYAKKVWKDFETKNLGYYHDLYFQSDTLLPDVFESFRNKSIEIYELDPAHILSAPGL